MKINLLFSLQIKKVLPCWDVAMTFNFPNKRRAIIGNNVENSK